mmetsp:Transcript_26810/g.71961  ORF Transcript_26810/g.71961 Transcript_26810/m.71961 type:complete len:319 (+) Transcript_26810:324-1280(+)
MVRKPIVSMGVAESWSCSSKRPTKWVANCELAAFSSCFLASISTMVQPSVSNTDKKRSVRSGLVSVTFSKTNGSSPQLPRPDSGPNMGWVHNTSQLGGATCCSTALGCSLTLSTSTSRQPDSRWPSSSMGKPTTVSSKDRMLTATITTSSRSCVRKAAGPPLNSAALDETSSSLAPRPPKCSTPISVASGRRSERERHETWCPCERKRRARNCPNLPKPITPIESGRALSSAAFSFEISSSAARIWTSCAFSSFSFSEVTSQGGSSFASSFDMRLVAGAESRLLRPCAMLARLLRLAGVSAPPSRPRARPNAPAPWQW